MGKEQIPVYIGALMIAIAGASGGFINSLLIHLKIVQAATTLTIDGKNIKLTYLVNIISGTAAALLSWGLYGSAVNVGILGTMNRDLLTLPAVFGAALVGYSGSSWLTTHADKREWQKNTQAAIEIPPSNNTAIFSTQMTKLSPTEVGNKIRELKGSNTN
jgi:hypothetical protein